MKAGQVYKTTIIKTGEEIVLRSIKWEDLYTLLEFKNSLVNERLMNEDFGLSLDKIFTREEEMKWLSSRLIEIEEGKVINVAAFHNDKLVGNSDIKREKYKDRKHHGILSIAVLSGWGDKGIGTIMMQELFEQAKKEGMKSLQLEVLNNNSNAIHLYEKLGFVKVGVIPRKVIRNNKSFDSVIMYKVL